MRDKRPVDELSIEELERILAVRKREERQKRLEKMRREGRVVENPAAAPAESLAPVAPPAFAPAAPPPSAGNGDAQPEDEAPAFPPPMEGELTLFEDDDPYDTRAAAEGGINWRGFANGFLLVIEVAAVLGLIVIGYNLFQAIGKLESETASAVALADEQRRAGIPTVAPTPQLRLEAVVLPSGHTFSPSGAPQFNYDEIPSHLLALVQDQIVQPPPRRPPPTDSTALRLIIPKLNVDQTIVQGVDWEALRLGIGQMINGATPASESGNVVLAAHNDIYGETFRYLDQLEPGDQFQIQTRTQVYTYTVSSWDLFEPTDVHVMDDQGGATATLISCYPYQVNDKRIVVFATRDSL